jgi:hypothetical protein
MRETAMTRPMLTRRTFLRSTSVALALPLLDAMSAPKLLARTGSAAAPRRMVAICTSLGIHTPFLYPEKAGRDFATTPYLEVLAEHGDQLTVFSGLSHPEVDGGHSSELSFLTAAPHPGSGGFKNTISLDQYLSERMGSATRFSSLALGTGQSSLSWTRSGIRVPADTQPSKVFARLFLDGTPEEVRTQVRRLADGQSIMDTVQDQARTIERRLGRRDRAKLDEYFTSVRELEQRLVKGQAWAKTPKPRVNVAPPKDITNHADMVGHVRLMCDLIHLALQTDSTRLVTLAISGLSVVPPIAGVSLDWHNLSHHGKDPSKLEQLAIIEKAELKLLGDLLTKLRATAEGDATLLDRTMVLYGSNLGNSSSHDTRNMPMLLAGGGFKHGQHLAFDPQNHPPLANLFVSMLQRLGLEDQTFASGTGPLAGLEPSVPGA